MSQLFMIQESNHVTRLPSTGVIGPSFFLWRVRTNTSNWYTCSQHDDTTQRPRQAIVTIPGCAVAELEIYVAKMHCSENRHAILESGAGPFITPNANRPIQTIH